MEGRRPRRTCVEKQLQESEKERLRATHAFMDKDLGEEFAQDKSKTFGKQIY